MINVSIKIGENGAGKVDTFDQYGFAYLSSDNRFAPPSKGFGTTKYPEEEGEHTDAKTVDDAFDYKIRFLVGPTNGYIKNANLLIKNFNEKLYEHEINEGDIKTFKQVTFYNTYKKVKIVGYPSPIAEATSFWRDKFGQVSDAVEVELTLRVTKPSLCDFNYEGGED